VISSTAQRDLAVIFVTLRVYHIAFAVTLTNPFPSLVKRSTSPHSIWRLVISDLHGYLLHENPCRIVGFELASTRDDGDSPTMVIELDRIDSDIALLNGYLQYTALVAFARRLFLDGEHCYLVAGFEKHEECVFVDVMECISVLWATA
jgi:hypothetical protein